MGKEKSLEELIVFQKAMAIGEEVWATVSAWNNFQKNTIGRQWIRSTDSIAANIAEGYGRFHFKERKLFYYYSRGSLLESKTWLKKAHARKLVPNKKFKFLLNELNYENAILNNYIKSIGK